MRGVGGSSSSVSTCQLGTDDGSRNTPCAGGRLGACPAHGPATPDALLATGWRYPFRAVRRVGGQSRGHSCGRSTRFPATATPDSCHCHSLSTAGRRGQGTDLFSLGWTCDNGSHPPLGYRFGRGHDRDLNRRPCSQAHSRIHLPPSHRWSPGPPGSQPLRRCSLVAVPGMRQYGSPK